MNLAARLEGQSKEYGVKVVIGEDTLNKLNDNFATLPLDRIAVKGKLEAVSIFTLLGDSDRASSPEFIKLKEVHEAMISAYLAQDWDKAEQLCKDCREIDNGEMSGFYDLYEDRISNYRQESPGADWDGVYIALTK